MRRCTCSGPSAPCASFSTDECRYPLWRLGGLSTVEGSWFAAIPERGDDVADSQFQAERSGADDHDEGRAGEGPAGPAELWPAHAPRLDWEAAAIDRGRDSSPLTCGFLVERVTRIELALSAWEADVLPLNYTRGRLGPAGTCQQPAGHDLPRHGTGCRPLPRATRRGPERPHGSSEVHAATPTHAQAGLLRCGASSGTVGCQRAAV